MEQKVQTGSHEVYRQDDGDELRVITLSLFDDGSAQICERTDGSYTLLAFGSLTHAQSLTVSGPEARRLVQELGAQQPGELPQALHAFFVDGCFLSDLQDFLDAADIQYAYSVVQGSIGAMRTPSEPRLVEGL